MFKTGATKHGNLGPESMTALRAQRHSFLNKRVGRSVHGEDSPPRPSSPPRATLLHSDNHVSAARSGRRVAATGLRQALAAVSSDVPGPSSRSPVKFLGSALPQYAAGVLIGLAALVLAVSAQAQMVGTLISNTGQGSTFSYSTVLDRAQPFTTGANSGGYTLSSVEIISLDTEGDDAALSVCTVDDNDFPTSDCTALTVPASFTAGTLEFTGNMTLAADTTYTLLLTSPGGENLKLGATSSDNEDLGGAQGWSIANVCNYKF